jgi:hypothetical protein
MTALCNVAKFAIESVVSSKVVDEYAAVYGTQYERMIMGVIFPHLLPTTT